MIAAVITGWFAWRGKKQESDSPTSVAGGYTVLVADLHREIAAARARSTEIEVQMTAMREAADRAVEAEQRCLERLAAMAATMAEQQGEINELREEVERLRSLTEESS